MRNRCLYLVSSSATREYVSDCLEALALPRGMGQHFRYRSKYIDIGLRGILPTRPGCLRRNLRDLAVVVVYLYQEQSGGTWKPGESVSTAGRYLPLRCGRLLDAFLDGDVAHFYFEVTDYVKPTLRRRTARALLNKNVAFQIGGRRDRDASYAHLGIDLRLGAPRANEASAFQDFVMNAYQPGEWRTRSLGRAPLDVIYDLVFMRIGGIFREKKERLVPVAVVRRPIVGNPHAEYPLEVGSTYYIQVSTYLAHRLAAELPGQGTATLRLGFDTSIFQPAGPTSFRISSAYDLHYWAITVVGTHASRSVLTISCDHNVAVDRDNFVRKELLCSEVWLPVSIGSAKRASE